MEMKLYMAWIALTVFWVAMSICGFLLAEKSTFTKMVFILWTALVIVVTMFLYGASLLMVTAWLMPK
jgi:hypothetical protein